ncbi:MerR family transcriptional regulator [Irregularibacter muris]|uniref:MerR family transcriptional regulator n=1 Tax=Irregularibacter muris TaxID=1796619 RepID=A0AAE3KZ01_9FIRM|nr:MerR family transcriptional regulator [Irregularibacter muris]MCR1897437.1 MerR family transcriptional regulator [Irregularibacter muris]
MNIKEYSIGDLVNATGITVRTLQHYDNIGLLPASERDENGRRYYTEGDIMKLEQIIFYKSLGFTLKEIQQRLVNETELKKMDELLDYQETTLYTQIEARYTSLSAIEAFRDIIALGKIPPWSFLASFISKLNDSDFLSWGGSYFSEEEMRKFEEHFNGLEDALAFYHTWKSLSIKAAIYNESEISSDEEIAQELAKQWLQMVEYATGGDEELRQIYIKVDGSREVWPDESRRLMDAADGYISDCVRLYCVENNLGLPW